MPGRHGERRTAVLAALGAGETVLGGIVALLQEGIVVQDGSGRIVEATPAAFTLLGLTEAELLGRNRLDAEWVVIDESGATIDALDLPAMQAQSSGETRHGTIGVRRPDGSLVWLAVTAVPLPVDVLDEPPVVVSTFVDVSDEVESRLRLRESEERFRLTLQNAPIGIALVDLEGAFIEANHRLALMLGRTRSELTGTTFQSLTHPDDLDADLALLERLVAGEIESYEMEKRYVTADGGVVRAHLTVGLVRDGSGAPLHFVSQIEDVTEIRQVQEMLEKRSLFDLLTGLANRNLVVDRLEQMLRQADPLQQPVAVLCCDLDRFKLVNDSFGHVAGDTVLRTVAARIAEAIEAEDTVGRGTGDEFLILIGALGAIRHPRGIVERLKSSVERPLLVSGHEITPSLSIGIAISGPGMGAEQLLHDAGSALYAAKAKGRARWEIFDRSMRTRAVERVVVESELRAAIDRGEVILHYQPVVELESRRVVAYEALARWVHAERGLLPPAAFIPVAEESGLIVDLGRALLRQACGFVARHPDDDFRVFVNVSPGQLGHDRFSVAVRDELHRTGIDPSRLGIELTETGVLEAAGSSLLDLNRIADMGVMLVLDDFGTGYSTVSALIASPVAGLKLDRSFTTRLGSDPQADLVTRALAGMVEALDFYGVVEGIETEAELQAVIAHGWHMGQGWLFGHAVPEEQLDLSTP